MRVHRSPRSRLWPVPGYMLVTVPIQIQPPPGRCSGLPLRRRSVAAWAPLEGNSRATRPALVQLGQCSGGARNTPRCESARGLLITFAVLRYKGDSTSTPTVGPTASMLRIARCGAATSPPPSRPIDRRSPTSSAGGATTWGTTPGRRASSSRGGCETSPR